MKKMCSVFGHFNGNNKLNGQTIKTEIFTNRLKQCYKNDVITFDTSGKLIALLKSPFQVLCACLKSKNIFIFPAQRGVKVYGTLLYLFKIIFFKKIVLHYVVIGAWLPDLLVKNSFFVRVLKEFDNIYVETSKLKEKLEKIGLNNLIICPNSKDISSLNKEDLVYFESKPYPLCTFSRIMREKGIEDAIKAIIEINNNCRDNIFTLDIYGQIDENQKEWFNELQESFPEYVKYRGEVSQNVGRDIIKNYYILLFPTRFYTEGIPGTILDAYAAGVPVLCSKWENCEDVVENNKTGLIYDFDNINDLYTKLMFAKNNPSKINSMKVNCLKEYNKYSIDTNIRIITQNII